MAYGTRLFGRDGDVARVASSLAATGRCAVVGPGGVGKSSVAREVGRAEAGQVIWIDAEPLDHLDALLDQLLGQMGLQRLPGESPADAVQSGLTATSAMIVLDGVEHMGDELAAVALSWPTSPTGPQLLVTSRRPLGSAILPVVRLDPLSTRDGGDRSSAAEMLIDEVMMRGGDVASLVADADLFDRVLAATGGLPVAIQLTADHVARFGTRFAAEQPTPVDQIIETCVDRTLTLLAEEDRIIFQRLGLTAGSFTLEVITACSGAPSPATEMAGRLVDHGLVIVEDGRFDMLPPIRDAAAGLLERSGDADVALDTLVAWVLAANAGSDEDAGTSVVVANLDTCIHLAWLAVRRPMVGDVAAELVHALFVPMHDRVRQTELLALLEAVLAGEELDPERYADTARRAAICAADCDTIAHARRWIDRAHEHASQIEDAALWSRIWSIDCWLWLDVGDHSKAMETAQRSIASDGVDGSGLMLQSMRCIAEAALAMGDLDHAEEVAGTVVHLAGSSHPSDALNARTTLGWCLVERGRHAEAVAFARRLADDIFRQQADPSEGAIEAELIAIAADPRIEPVAPSFDNDHRFTWWMRLQQRIRLAARLPIEEHWEHVMHTAADVVVLSDLVPLGYPRICATILLGDAGAAGGDLRHAARAYEQALRDAARGPYRLRGADAFDGVAVVADRMGHHELAGVAASAAAQARDHAGAAAWPRPSLPTTVTPNGTVPGTWLRDGVPTQTAIDEISRALHRVNRRDPLTTLTRAERHVAQLVGRGMSNNEIADHLVVSRRTVESHLARTFRKLDIRNRTQLAAMQLTPDR